ncbi:MAG TPA: DUF1549 and DUF1553 domain-containing protein, partial [Pirellulales bacterium]|nr:DUF1549 and DUF1553 domain-containing protein [Pirellulales bacterium]
DRDHWAFRPLRRPEVPAVQDAAWPAGPIDRIILARLEAKGLQPQPRVDRRALLRRVTFDLTGLPPTPADAVKFLADDSPQAYQRVVDRLLASPAYGERWAQHWLDLARFAETDGFEQDKVRPQAWRYRDWVIEALNRDLPVDEFIRVQIAGDELRPDDPQAAIATGFLLAGPDMPDLNLKEERRHMVLNEITSTVGAVFLGLQLGCAQCHDHKYDPISQADFYRLRSVFETAELFAKSSAERVVRESGLVPVSHVMVRGDFRREGAKIEPAFPRIVNATGAKIPQPPKGASGSGRRAALARWLTRPDHPTLTRVLANWVWQQHFGQGLCRTPSDFGLMGEVPSHPELLDWLATELIRSGWSMKQLHRQLVTSATYQQASRPAAADWSAEQTREALARWQHSVAVDPENRLLARYERRRLDGEAIRDAMLASAERLSAARGGPGVMAPLPEEMLATLLKGQWKTSSDEDDHRRRSIYLFVRRNLRYPLFEAFDRPDTNASCPRRNVSTTAPQALVMLNSEFSLAAARDLAGYVLRAARPDRAAQIELVYQRTLGRAPTAHEVRAAEKFLADQAAQLKSTGGESLALPSPAPSAESISKSDAAALVDLCLAMFNLNEFIYLD